MWSHPIYRNLLFCQDEVIYWYYWSSEFFTNDFEASLDIKFFYSGLERKKVDLGKNNNVSLFYLFLPLSVHSLPKKYSLPFRYFSCSFDILDLQSDCHDLLEKNVKTPLTES